MTTPFAEAFDQVGRAVEASRRFAEQNTAGRPAGVTADATSDDGAVDVTVADGVVSSLRLNGGWLRTTDERTVETSVRQAVNAALERYQEAALAQFTAASPSFAQLRETVADAQAQLRTAFDDHLSTTIARGEQQAARGYEGLSDR